MFTVKKKKKSMINTLLQHMFLHCFTSKWLKQFQLSLCYTIYNYF